MPPLRLERRALRSWFWDKAVSPIGVLIFSLSLAFSSVCSLSLFVWNFFAAGLRWAGGCPSVFNSFISFSSDSDFISHLFSNLSSSTWKLCFCASIAHELLLAWRFLSHLHFFLLPLKFLARKLLDDCLCGFPRPGGDTRLLPCLEPFRSVSLHFRWWPLKPPTLPPGTYFILLDSDALAGLAAVYHALVFPQLRRSRRTRRTRHFRYRCTLPSYTSSVRVCGSKRLPNSLKTI